MWNAGNGDMWTYILGSSKKNSSTLKRLVWKDNKKRLSNWSNEKCPKPSRNANLAKVSCENFAKFGSYKCAFRCSQNDILKKFSTSTVPGPPGCLCSGMLLWFVCMLCCMLACEGIVCMLLLLGCCVDLYESYVCLYAGEWDWADWALNWGP